MTTPAELMAADVSQRVRQADDEAANAMAAFAAGRFGEWWQKKAEEVQKRIDADGQRAVTN